MEKDKLKKIKEYANNLRINILNMVYNAGSRTYWWKYVNS